MEIEGHDFTLFYDIDQLNQNKLTLLTDDGKIIWLHERLKMLVVRPINIAFDKGVVELTTKEKIITFIAKILSVDINLARREFVLSSNTSDGQANLVIGLFSIIINAIEALGSFITLQNSTKRDNFTKYITDYMPGWDITIAGTTLYSSNNMIEILWKHFRNGIAHGLIIENGGLDFTADDDPNGYIITSNNYLQIGPRKFIANFDNSLSNYFNDISNNVGGKRTLFLRRFNSNYPN